MDNSQQSLTTKEIENVFHALGLSTSEERDQFSQPSHLNVGRDLIEPMAVIRPDGGTTPQA